MSKKDRRKKRKQNRKYGKKKKDALIERYIQEQLRYLDRIELPPC